jgi:DNA recombination protein RmuC
LDKVKKKLDEASSSIEAVQVRTRAVDRKLKSVHELPTAQADEILSLE